MSKKQKPNPGLLSSSKAGLKSKNKVKSTNSPISKYFSNAFSKTLSNAEPKRSTNSTKENTSKNKNLSDDDDFESPKNQKKKVIKWELTKTKVYSKKSGKSKKPLTNSTIKIIEQNFKDLDVNPEHLQMGIMLSKSEYEADNPNFQSPVEDTPDLSCLPGAILERFGFKSDRPVTRPVINVTEKPRRRKFAYITPILLKRTKADRDALISANISLILSQNTNKIYTRKSLTQNQLFSDALMKLLSKEKKIFGLTTVSKTSKFIVEGLNLNESEKAPCGFLLRDWNSIPAISEEPAIYKNAPETDDIILKSDNNSQSDLPVVKPIDSINFPNKSIVLETVNKESNTKELESLLESTLKPPVKVNTAFNRSISPDLFSSDTENSFIEKSTIATKVDGEPIDTINVKSPNVTLDKKQTEIEKTGVTVIIDDDDKNVNKNNSSKSDKSNLKIEKVKYSFDSDSDVELEFKADHKQNTHFDIQDDIDSIGPSNVNIEKHIEISSTEKSTLPTKDDGEQINTINDKSPLDKKQTDDIIVIDDEDDDDNVNEKVCLLEKLKYNITMSNLSSGLFCNKTNPEKFSLKYSFDSDDSDMEIEFNSKKVQSDLKDGIDCLDRNVEKVCNNDSLSDSCKLNESQNLSNSKNNFRTSLTAKKESDLSLNLDFTNRKSESFKFSPNKFFDETANNLNVTDYINNMLNSQDQSFANESRTTLEGGSKVEHECHVKNKELARDNAECDSPKSNYATDDPYLLVDNLSQASNSFINELNKTDFCNVPTDYVNISRHSTGESGFWSEGKDPETLDVMDNLVTNQPTTSSCSNSEITPDKGANTKVFKNMLIKTTNVTPMQDYDIMNTPTITKELDKYGIKPLKRSRGVTLLKHIYDSLHPVIGQNNEQEKVDSDEDNRIFKKRKSNELFPSLEAVGGIEIVGDALLQNEPIDNLIFERKQSVRIHSCRVPLQIVWHNFVSSSPDLKENILLYEPLELEILHQSLKEIGYKFHLQDLLTFLDKKCITVRIKR